MIFFSLTLFFSISCLFLIGLLLLDSHVTGRFQIALRLGIHALSVGLFFAFLWYLTTLLVRPCEFTQTLAVTIILFVLLGGGLFYYIGRKNI